jgi:hypothetical protein
MNVSLSLQEIRKKVERDDKLSSSEILLLLMIIEAWENSWGPLKLKTSDGRSIIARDLLYEDLEKEIKKKGHVAATLLPST